MYANPLQKPWMVLAADIGHIPQAVVPQPFASLTEMIHGRSEFQKVSTGNLLREDHLEIAEDWPEYIPSFPIVSGRTLYDRFSSPEAFFSIRSQILSRAGESLWNPYTTQNKQLVLEICKLMLVDAGKIYFGVPSDEFFLLKHLPIPDLLECRKIIATSSVEMRLNLVDFIISELQEVKENHYTYFLTILLEDIVEPLIQGQYCSDKKSRQKIVNSMIRYCNDMVALLENEPFHIDAQMGLSNVLCMASRYPELQNVVSDRIVNLKLTSPDRGYYYIAGAKKFVWNAYALKLLYRTIAGLEINSYDGSLLNTRPLHSLADFNPDVRLKRPILEKKCEELRWLIERHGLSREKVLDEYFMAPDTDGNVNMPLVLRFPNLDINIIVQGHHRIAALILLYQQGVIPQTWITNLNLPCSEYSKTTEPEHFVYYFSTGGQNKTWDEVLSGG